MLKNKKKIIIKIFVFFLILSISFNIINYYVSIKVEEKIMYAEDIKMRSKQILYLLNNGYHNKKMLDIKYAYGDIVEKMVPVEGITAVDYVKVKQRYREDKKDGWIPVGLPKVEFFYNNK